MVFFKKRSELKAERQPIGSSFRDNRHFRGRVAKDEFPVLNDDGNTPARWRTRATTFLDDWIHRETDIYVGARKRAQEELYRIKLSKFARDESKSELKPQTVAGIVADIAPEYKQLADPKNQIQPEFVEVQRLKQITQDIGARTRGILTSLLIDSLVDTPFFRNVFFYNFMWLSFYVMDYLYPVIHMHWPVFDIFIVYPFFTWMHPLAFFPALLFLSILTLPFFFYILLCFRFTIKRLGMLGFDILVYAFAYLMFCSFFAWFHLVGTATPFVGLSFSFFSFFLYFFLYAIPNTKSIFFIEYLNHICPKYLPAPVPKSVQLYLPKFYYHYSFGEVVIGTMNSRKNVGVFKPKVRQLYLHYRRVRDVIYYSIKKRLALQPFTFRFSSEPFIPSFNRIYGYDPEAHFIFYLKGQRDGWLPEATRKFPASIFNPSLEHSVFINYPLGVANNVFFSPQWLNRSKHLYSGLGFGYPVDDLRPQLPLWKQFLWYDPYYNLFLWLPTIRTHTNRTDASESYLYEIADNYQLPSISTRRLPGSLQFIHRFYAFVEESFDFVTNYKYLKYEHFPENVRSASERNVWVCIWAFKFSRGFEYTYSPYIRELCRFLRAFSTHFSLAYELRQPGFHKKRVELIYIFSEISETLAASLAAYELSFAQFSESTTPEARMYARYLLVAKRFANKVLLELTASPLRFPDDLFSQFLDVFVEDEVIWFDENLLLRAKYGILLGSLFVVC